MKGNMNPPATFPEASNSTLYAFAAKRSLDFTLSENPLGCSPLVTEVAQQGAGRLDHYPLPQALQLRRALAGKVGGEPENFFVSNGSEAIVALIPRLLAKPGDKAITPRLTFPLFALSCQQADMNVVFANMTTALGIDLGEILSKITLQTRLIFVCNPNNPTGNVLTREKLQTFLNAVPETVIIIIDEANIEFGGETLANEALKRPNVLVLRTFSKGFGLASARVGFALGSEKLIAHFLDNTPPFPITSLSEKLALCALHDQSFLENTRLFMTEQREFLTQALRSLRFTVFPSSANTLFVQLPSELDSAYFWEKVSQSDISLISGTFFPGFNETFFRLSPRTAELNRQFVEVIKAMKGTIV